MNKSFKNIMAKISFIKTNISPSSGIRNKKRFDLNDLYIYNRNTILKIILIIN